MVGMIWRINFLAFREPHLISVNDYGMLRGFHVEESELINTPFGSLLNFCIPSGSND